MAHELILHPDSVAAFAPQYFGSVDYYAALSSYGKVYVDLNLPSDKRFKSAHRCRVIDTREEIMLTVPVAKPHGPHSWLETPVSSHGRWAHVHLTALESAYGRTPFFEFYIDRFAGIFSRDYETDLTTVGELDRECDLIVRSILGIDNDVIYSTPTETVDADFRRIKEFKASAHPYYQLRADRLGFRAGLSILDLIFNLGPEAPLHLLQLSKKNRIQSDNV